MEQRKRDLRQRKIELVMGNQFSQPRRVAMGRRYEKNSIRFPFLESPHKRGQGRLFDLQGGDLLMDIRIEVGSYRKNSVTVFFLGGHNLQRLAVDLAEGGDLITPFFLAEIKTLDRRSKIAFPLCLGPPFPCPPFPRPDAQTAPPPSPPERPDPAIPASRPADKKKAGRD